MSTSVPLNSSLQENNICIHPPLLTDFYLFTMAQGYFLEKNSTHVVFDVFFRTQPFSGGFSICAGLETLLKSIESMRFTDSDIQYLKGTGRFKKAFLEYLKTFKFNGDVFAMKEGSVCFPYEPLIRVHASILEAQLIESLVLNTINFQTLIATKSARQVLSAKGKQIIELGLRRAQGPNGALYASRAAFIGGVSSTSNVLAGKMFAIPVNGTMSHSWIMNFNTEEEAFETYSSLYLDNTVFLLDTYDTLQSGLPNAIKVGKKLKRLGKSFGVRIDSGDLEYLSKKVRERLDAEGLGDIFIVASNELDEQIISELTKSAPIDVWGVGTSLVTGGTDSAFTGVYKLSAKKKTADPHYIPAMKITNHIQKSTLPGVKQVYRYSDIATGVYIADLICLQDSDDSLEGEAKMFFHPHNDQEKFILNNRICTYVPLLEHVMNKGRVCYSFSSLHEIREYVRKELRCLDATHKRLLNPHVYRVSISEKLKKVRNGILKKNEHHSL